MKKLRIAVDGPSGAGKSELAKALARELGCIYVDTGALYRAVGLNAARLGLSKDDGAGIAASLEGLRVSIKRQEGEQRIFIGDEDVSGLIRTPDISAWASVVSALPEVRAFLGGLQRDAAARGNVIMDGRDIGTVIMPDADVKIFLTARAEVRAERRRKQDMDKGRTDVPPLEEYLREMQERDRRDSRREHAPAVAAADAAVLDNSDIDFEHTVEKALGIIRERTVGK